MDRCSYNSFAVRRRRRNPQSGSALLELALVLPFMLILVLGTAFFGRVFYTSILVNNAARAGAAYGMRYPCGTPPCGTAIAGTVSAAVQDAQPNLPAFGPSNVSATYYCSCPAPEGILTSCYDPTGLVHTCAAPGYGQPQLYVQVDTTYTFNTFGTGANGAPVQVCLPGSLCIPASVTLNGHASIRAQ